MSRDLTSAMASAIDAEVVWPAVLYAGVFATGTVRLWDGIGDLSWDGHTWTGSGHLLGISAVGENEELRAEGFEVTLSGLPLTSLEVALLNIRQGMPGYVWLALLNASGTVISDPYLLVEGRLDNAPVLDAPDKSDISTRYEDVLIDLDKARDRRYTNEDQQIEHPDDTGFRYVPMLQDKVFFFGGPGAGASLVAPPLLLTNAR